MSIAEVIKADDDKVKVGQKIYNSGIVDGKKREMFILDDINGRLFNFFATEKVIKEFIGCDLAYDENDNPIWNNHIIDIITILTTIP